MDMFEKASRVMKSVGDDMINSAINFSNTFCNTTKVQSEIASLNVQKSLIEKKLSDAYMEIGKRYVAYMNHAVPGAPFDVSDVMEKITPELEKMAQVDEELAQKEQQMKDDAENRSRKRAEEEFESTKKKLDQALEMSILTETEYAEKLTAAQKKLDYYDQIRKVELQYQMGIITKAEFDAKMKAILG